MLSHLHASKDKILTALSRAWKNVHFSLEDSSMSNRFLLFLIWKGKTSLQMAKFSWKESPSIQTFFHTVAINYTVIYQSTELTLYWQMHYYTSTGHLIPVNNQRLDHPYNWRIYVEKEITPNLSMFSAISNRTENKAQSWAAMRLCSFSAVRTLH